MAKGENFSVYMSQEFKDEIDYFVELKKKRTQGQWSRSSFIRKAIDEYIEKCMLEFPNEVIKKEKYTING